MARSFCLAYRAASLDVLLASVPSPPRAILARLTARMIERLGDLDRDACDTIGQPTLYGHNRPR